jgi:hypothetical protein
MPRISPPIAGRGFGRLVAPDQNDKQYPMKKAIRRVPLPTSKMWHSKQAYVLDQGPVGACVGFSWATFLEASPYAHQLSNADGMLYYHLAQQNDEWAGEDYEGSSVRGGAKALKSLGLIEGSYIWAASEEDIWRFVLTRGPVNMGTVWLTGMMDTDSKGYLNLTGGEEGGHAWCIIGASSTRNAYRMQQTWGLGWGDKGSGRAWVRRPDLKTLLEELGGECCSATEVLRAA